MNLLINGFQKYSYIPSLSAKHSTVSFKSALQSDTFEKEQKQKTDNLVQTDIFYINDNHGRIGNMARIYTAKTMYDNLNKNSKADKFRKEPFC